MIKKTTPSTQQTTRTAQSARRVFSGTVVSDKMKKTLVVRVDRVVVHPKYGKRYAQSQKFHVHDEGETFHVGDTVTFVECRPYSKTKRWCTVKIQS